MRILVKPESASNLRVTIDGQPMSAALVGVERPTDPGAHTIVVAAQGYARAEQSVALKEHDSRDVTITLQPQSGAAPIAIAPGPVPPPPPPYGSD